jgi:uncharacterized protein YdeI (YjbR/CyaY-like superfamily)
MSNKFEIQLESCYAKNRKEWREWLEKNHSISVGVWLIYYKVKSGQLSVKYSEAVEALIIPADLKQSLEANETAKKYFDKFSNSLKKNILVCIEITKRLETRLKRIEQTISSVAQNKNPWVR